MLHITKEDMVSALTYERLIPCLREAFTKDYKLPKRHHHQYPNPQEGMDSTLLLMPAWDDGKNLGVKVASVNPNNGRHNLPSIQGVYLLFDLPTGVPKAQMDAKTLTAKRTAATSALASSYLSRPDSATLLVIGTGALSPELIRAHTAIRPITNVYVWGRNFSKAQKVASQFEDAKYSVTAIETIDEQVRQADIVSCATLSPTPLIFGKDLQPGQHFDMIGAYKADMRETDDCFISSVSIFVDSYESASKETGDLAIPLAKSIITMNDLQASLFELCRNQKNGRTNNQQITCFESVGHSLEDLAAASLTYELLNDG